ncbi:type VI secretion system protein TssA [Anatilimnocola sp. NA78]|uniref:type VI secretion system protein TssA n=1 Tax=Anatilimnocola sp. NA78 TaxID=3415683 RepID=UPI003CE4729F
MPTSPLLDLETLLAPVPGDNPTGAYLRYSSGREYDLIRDLRPKRDQAIFEDGSEGPQAGQWKTIIAKGQEFLQTKSKDLQLAAWLTEALTNQHGFAGLRDGLQLITGLLQTHWEGLFPPADDGDLETRVAPLEWLLGDTGLPIWVREVPLADRPAEMSGDAEKKAPVTYNLWHSIKVNRSADAEVFVSSMEAVVSKTPPAFFKKLHEDLRAAREALEAYNTVADEQFGRLAPGVSAVRTALEQCQNRIETICKERKIPLQETAAMDDTADSSDDDSGTKDESVSYSGSSNGHSGPVRSRAEALEKLREIADYLRQAEPHSPVSYLIQRAISWSEMPFEKLLLELVQDQNARALINNTLGIKEDPYGDSSGSSYDSENG